MRTVLRVEFGGKVTIVRLALTRVRAKSINAKSAFLDIVAVSLSFFFTVKYLV